MCKKLVCLAFEWVCPVKGIACSGSKHSFDFGDV